MKNRVCRIIWVETKLGTLEPYTIMWLTYSGTNSVEYANNEWVLKVVYEYWMSEIHIMNEFFIIILMRTVTFDRIYVQGSHSNQGFS